MKKKILIDMGFGCKPQPIDSPAVKTLVKMLKKAVKLGLLDAGGSLPRQKPTKKTKETEKYVDKYITENGYPPTYQEIVKQFNLNSTNSAYARCRHFRYKMKRVNNNTI